MRRLARFGALAAVVAGSVTLAALVALVTAGGSGGETAAPDGWDDVVERVREQVRAHTFTGVVAVEWYDGGAHHRERIEVSHAGGIVHVEGDDSLVLSEEAAALHDGVGWEVLARRSVAADAELASRKYVVEERDGPLVAGRPTTVFEARHEGVAVERVYVDDDSGVALRRERLDPDGRVVRAVTFERLEIDVPMATSYTVAAAPAPEAVEELHDARDPRHAGPGFALLGRWLHRDGTAQLLYSDGVLTVSVFEQRGDLAWEALPPGEDVSVGGARARAYSLPAGEVVVFERDGLVFTCVGDTSRADLLALAADVSAPRDSIWRRVGDTVLAPFRW